MKLLLLIPPKTYAILRLLTPLGSLSPIHFSTKLWSCTWLPTGKTNFTVQHKHGLFTQCPPSNKFYPWLGHIQRTREEEIGKDMYTLLITVIYFQSLPKRHYTHISLSTLKPMYLLQTITTFYLPYFSVHLPASPLSYHPTTPPTHQTPLLAPSLFLFFLHPSTFLGFLLVSQVIFLKPFSNVWIYF